MGDKEKLIAQMMAAAMIRGQGGETDLGPTPPPRGGLMEMAATGLETSALLKMLEEEKERG